MADRRKNAGHVVENIQETERQFMDKHNVTGMFKDVVTNLLANRPDDPLSFLANYFKNMTPDYRTDDCVLKAKQLITMTHYSRPVFETNLIRAFEILSHYKISKRLHGINGGVLKLLLQSLCNNTPVPVQDKLFKKIDCSEHEAISYTIFRSTIFTCCVLNDFLTLSCNLFISLDIKKSGRADRNLCQTVLQQLRASLSTSKKDIKSVLESSYNLAPDHLYKVLDQAMAKSTAQLESYSQDQFLIEACDIFIAKNYSSLHFYWRVASGDFFKPRRVSRRSPAWRYLEEINECSQCFCGSKGYTCRDCGNTLRVPPSKEKCYADFDNSLSFPKCCKLVLVCEGDADFDASRLFI
ncbi:Tubulin polyglutamylase complex subunit 1 [Bulinus truncatus]|nr:Tubulin polyglutamylase complex subunit 1 [Bulinus truncatus]